MVCVLEKFEHRIVFIRTLFLLDTRNLAFYTRYVGDILIAYNTTRISSHTINTYINNRRRNVKINPTYEQHRSIDFLDLTITRKYKQLEVDIEQKMAAFGFNITRMHSLHLDPDKKQKEWKTIQSKAKNNNFPRRLLQN